MSDGSPDYRSPNENYADEEKSKSSSKRSSLSSPSSDKNKERKLIKTINEKKAAGKPFSKETRQLTVLKHFENIRTEQKDYNFSIQEGDNSQAIYEKILKLEKDAESYSKKFIAGKMPEDRFRDRSSKTIENLKEFLAALPKFISLEKETKKLLKKKEEKVKKIKELTGAPPPNIKKLPPKIISPREDDDDKPSIIDSVIRTKTKSQIPKTKYEKATLKITRRKKTVPTKAPQKAKKAETYKREGQQITDKPSRSRSPSATGPTTTNTVRYPPTGITRGARTPPKIKPHRSRSSKKSSPDKGFVWKPEYAMPELIKKTKKRIKKPSPGIIKPQRNLNNMSNSEIIKIFNGIPELKWPKTSSTSSKSEYARKELKKYFDKQNPGRRLNIKTTTTIPAQWHPPMSTEGFTADRRRRYRKDTIVTKRATKQIRLRKPKTKPKRPKKAKDKRKRIQTNIVYDAQNPQYWKLQNKKLKEKSPTLNVIYQTQQKTLFDPRPSWDYKPNIHTATYESYKNSMLKKLENNTQGNQFRLAQLINAVHKELQINRAKLDAIIPPRNFKPLDGKTKKWLDNLKPTEPSTLPPKQSPLLIKLQGHIRPKKTKFQKGKYYKESPKAPNEKTIFKKIPVEVLTTPIPPHYSRVEKMMLPPSSSKDEIKKKRKYVTKEVVLRTPNWEEVEATGLIEKSGNATYKTVTREDLEDYLGKTYLLGYDNHFNGGEIKMLDEDRKYAYERAIDLRRCRGTVLETGVVVITRSVLEKARPKVVGAPGTDKTTEEKAIEKAYDLSRRIYEIYQNHKPKTTLKQKGKKKVAETLTHLTEEQYKQVLKGKVIEGLPMTTEQISRVIKKLQEPLKELIAMQAATENLDTINKVESHINQVTKFIENIKTSIAYGPAPIKRKKETKKKKGVSIFLRGKKGRKDDSSPSSSSSGAVPDDDKKKSPSSSSKKKSPSSNSLSDLEAEMEAELKTRAAGDKIRGQTIQEFLEEMRQEEEERRVLREAGIEIPRVYPEMLDPSRPVQSYLG
tara:strand:+ start:19299 stop:22358 length:3060 start_codon:yes stop_codon:yes gene_type:complete